MCCKSIEDVDGLYPESKRLVRVNIFTNTVVLRENPEGT